MHKSCKGRIRLVIRLANVPLPYVHQFVSTWVKHDYMEILAPNRVDIYNSPYMTYTLGSFKPYPIQLSKYARHLSSTFVVHSFGHVGWEVNVLLSFDGSALVHGAMHLVPKLCILLLTFFFQNVCEFV